MEFQKNKYISLTPGILIIFFLIVSIYSCNNSTEPTVPTINNSDPRILKVDASGRIIGSNNDWSDWCFDTISYSGERSHLYGAYPNPADSVVHINFDLAASDSAAMYFLKSDTDTAFVFRKRSFSAGSYLVQINRHDYGLAATYQRVYFINKNGLTSTSKPCNNYGDILFTK